MLRPMRIRVRIILLFIALTTATSLIYSLILLQSRENALLDEVDVRIESAARAAAILADPHYHDHIAADDSLSAARFDDLVNAFDRLCLDMDLSYVWSVMRLDGRVVFTTATRTEKLNPLSDCAKFLEPHTNPAVYERALDTQRVEFSTFDDRWGQGRMVLIPSRDGRGRPYLFAASVPLGDLRALQQATLVDGLLLSLAVGLMAVLISLILARSLTRPIKEITREAERIAAGDRSARIDESGLREISTLARGFNRMNDELHRRIEELRAGEENLRITLDAIGDGVIATDDAGRVVRMNPVAEKLLGWRSEEAEGKPLPEVFRIVNSKTRKVVDNPVDKVLRLGQIVGLANHTILVSRDGSEYRIADSGAPIRGADGRIRGVILVFRDVTREVSAEEQLRQSQKMQAIGQLAGGVAHDFNNLLSAIMGNAELLSMKLENDSELQGFARQIFQASCRAEELTQQLLVFSRKGRLRTSEIDLHRMIGEVVSLLTRAVDRKIVISTRLEAVVSRVEGDANQLQNAVLNLGLNARDAMREGGEMVFSTRNLILDEEFCKAQTEPLEPGAYLELALTDGGCGMSVEVIRHIFEPFFTTKKPGEGTGLGLAAVYGCVRSHGGLIQVYSRQGEGSVFKMLLPLTAADKKREMEKERPPQRGDGVILIVDDEELVRTFTSSALRNLGYKVLTCKDGIEAVDMYRDNHERIDMVVLDMIMPNLSGEETYRLLKAIDPNVRVLLSSGFSGGEATERLLRDGALDFLQKPYRIAELANRIARIIPARETGAADGAAAGQARQ